MHYGKIYLIENLITGDKYVGQTTQGVLKRFAQHAYSSRYERAKKYSYLARAMAKYGVESFSVKALYSANTQQELNAREALAVRLLKPKYNIKEAGANGKFSNESRKKLSIAKTGVSRGPHKEETKAKISKSNRGKKRSDETRRRLSVAHLGKLSPHHQKGISIFDTHGCIILDFPTQQLAADILGVGRSSLSNAVLNPSIEVARRYKVVSFV